MKQTVELKKLINAKRNEVEAAQKEEDLTKAAELADELNTLLEKYKVAEALEASEMPENNADDDDDDDDPDDSDDQDTDVKNHATFKVTNRMNRRLHKIRNRAFNKLVFNKGKLTDEERLAYFNDGDTSVTKVGQMETVDEKGGYLVPEEQLAIFREYRQYRVALKDYCNIVKVNSRTGKFPTMKDEDGTLFDFDELEQIPKSDLDFSQVKFEVHLCGDIIVVSNALLQDAVNVNLMSIIGKRFAIKSVNTENKKILALLDTLTPTTATSYKDFVSAINTKLDRAYFDSAKIFTNQDGFDWMDTLEDVNKRPLLTVDVTEQSKMKFRGKEIVVLSNKQLKTTSKIPFYIGNLADYCLFADREGVEIATSTEYAFDIYGTTLRCVERFGVSKDDSESMIKLEVAA